MLQYTTSITFDDVMLVPQYSNLKSRSEVSLKVNLCKGFSSSLPFIPSNMKSVTELKMARLMYDCKSLAVLHRFTDFETQLQWLEEAKKWGSDALRHVGFSIGIKDEDRARAEALIKNGVQILAVDVAHGHSEQCLAMVEWLAAENPNILIIAGSVATKEGAADLWRAGCDVVKSGIGCGSICLTRINAAAGVGALTSLSNCHSMKHNIEIELQRPLFLMNDGGCKSSGDLVKALCFADLCMSGNLFAGTDEAAGDIVEVNGEKYKTYVGSSTHKSSHKEGVEALKKCKGPAYNIIQSLTEGIKSGCSYQGVRNLTDLKYRAIFTRLSPAALAESGAHDLDIVL